MFVAWLWTPFVSTAIEAGAQGFAGPLSHWGANSIPTVRDRADLGLHFFGFTRYGKELAPEDSTRYAFLPYNGIGKTYGFNAVSYTRLDNNWRGAHAARASSVNTSGYARRLSAMIGIVDDHIPEWLQNTVIHQGNLRGNDKLARVPRDTTDAVDQPSLGPTIGWPPVLSLAAEYFLRLSYDTDAFGEESERIFTPLFVGGGGSMGTLMQDFFVSIGSSLSDWEPGNLGLGSLRIRNLGLGAMVKGGFLAPGHFFRDVASSYLATQGSARAKLEIAHFPIEFEYALAASSGALVAARTAAQQREIDIRGGSANGVYFAKTPIPERFYSLRIRIGQFAFETFNDSPGGKDKGPSFGASLSVDLYRPPKESGR